MSPLDHTSCGLCSVTLRALPPEEVVRCAVEARLKRVEWAADTHAPPTSAARLREVRQYSEEHGLTICSYGSYWRAGAHPRDDLPTLLEGAATLGTSRIRIWAGDTGSSSANADQWWQVTSDVRWAADRAADRGIQLAFEFHGGTLTDTPEATLRLLDQVAHPAVSTYWQPPLNTDPHIAVEGFDKLLDHVSAIHVFSWWPGAQRLRLHARATLWRAVLARLATSGHVPDLLLEFVPDDDPALVPAEAAVLQDWLNESKPS